MERQLGQSGNKQQILAKLARIDAEIDSTNDTYPIHQRKEYGQARLLFRKSLKPVETVREFLQRERQAFRTRVENDETDEENLAL